MQKTSTRDVHVSRTEPLITPAALMEQLPITAEIEQTVLDGRGQVQRIIEGKDARFMAVVGPCSIHDEKAAIEYAGRLEELAGRLSDRLLVVMRVYFEKPRTTVGWKGLVYDPNLNDTFDIASGLRRARQLLLDIGEMGVYAGTEFLDPIVPQYIAGLVSWATIGARTIESQTHRQMASGLSMPVGFKNSTDGSTQVAVDAVISATAPHGFLGIDRDGRSCIVHTTGNPYGHLVLRGGSRGPNFGKNAITEAHDQLVAAGVRPQLLVDCSHGNSSKDHTRESIAFRDVVGQRVAGDAGIIGCMLESNLSPGNQKLDSDRSKLKYGVSITDACIGWKETEELLAWAYGELG
jgi:3-deoxy-7-phosphoheptulonate synthase